jgi:hypothetical protein
VQLGRFFGAARTNLTEPVRIAPDWGDRLDGERQAMGRCFKYFALHRVLPITLANPEAPYNFKYRLNASLEQAPAAMSPPVSA